MSIKSFKEFCNEDRRVEDFLATIVIDLLSEPHHKGFIKHLKNFIAENPNIVNTKDNDLEDSIKLLANNNYISKEQEAEALKLIEDTRSQLKSK